MVNNNLNIKKYSRLHGSSKIKGFTLIELLAVIIILGILMIIAIPSITEYIQGSRERAYITIAKQYISGARNNVNSGALQMYDTDLTYYLPTSCISLESGGDSPFGELEEAYVVVTYDGNGYNYYWTSRDSSNIGIYLTSEDLLVEDIVQSGITSINKNVGVGNRYEILLIGSSCNLSDAEKIAVEDLILEKSGLDSNGKSISDNRLYDIIKKEAVLDSISSTYVTSENGIDFTKASGDTNGKGMYIRSGTENNANPIYYYRGAVTNNNVIFAGFCWKIVRTTDTGGIKLLYNGVAKDGKCNNTGDATHIGKSAFNSSTNDNAYVGYMYGVVGATTYEETHANINSSTIKSYVDTWYESNIDKRGYTTRLEDAVWCNDRSLASSSTGTGIAKSVTEYAAFEKFIVNAAQPSLSCSNENDRFTVSTSNGNGALTYPVALLTADEANLAGHVAQGYNSSIYSYNGKVWWTMSPGSFTGSVSYSFLGYSYLDGNGVQYLYVVRPAISLKHFVEITSGDGTVTNPYVIA